MSRPASEAIGPPQEVLNVVIAPSSAVVLRSVLDVVCNLDRRRWYPSLLIEGSDETPDCFALGQAARGIGIPVMSVRSRNGRNGAGRVRIFVDEWFLVRNAHASIVHVHSAAALNWSAPVNWVRFAMPRLPFVVSTYEVRDGDSVVARVDIRYRRIAAPVSETDGSPADVSQLYQAALATIGGD